MSEPPWREVTNDEIHPRVFPDGPSGEAWIAAERTARDLLERQLAGEFRIRYVLREVADLKRGPETRTRPGWLYSYELGNGWMVGCAREVEIELRGGRRAVVPIPRSGDNLQWPGWCWADGTCPETQKGAPPA